MSLKRISITVKTRAHSEGVVALPTGELQVSVRAIPEKGLANKKIVDLLAEYLNVPKSRLRIGKGKKSKHKIVELIDT